MDSIATDRKNKAFAAAKAGAGHVYIYGLEALAVEQKQFYALGKHKIKPLEKSFEPNPFVYQYDLEVHLFLNYNSIVERELELVQRAITESRKAGLPTEQLNNKLRFIEKRGTGLHRSEHFWNAAQLRWPTKTEEDGRETGEFIREPWGEDYINALCKYDYVNTFGGSGQGKTHRALAFMCIGWDHYIDTQIGGRCLFSTVSESKIQSSTWPYLQRIYKASAKGISLYCGRGIAFGEYTITRPTDKKGGSHIRGILLPRRGDSLSVDKITGSHGHPIGIYHIDEIQSTPPAPIEASPNFLQNCAIGWISSSGNYDKDHDSLGRNAPPVGGWDTVDEETHIYEGVNMLGIRCGCIHYNNDLSPAFEGEGFKKWRKILPTKEKKNKRYPSELSRRSDSYRRLWIGWREKNQTNDSVLNTPTLRACGAMSLAPNFDERYPVTHGWSFDSAPANKDRNILTHFADGIDKATSKWKIHFYESVAISKTESIVDYLDNAVREILRYSKLWGVKSGNSTLDWTNITGLPEKLRDKGFETKWIVYNQAPPDGKRRDPRSGEVLPAVIVEAGEEIKFAHTECSNMISMGAMLCQNFILNGQLTGLHEDYINTTNSSKTYEEELCLRRSIRIGSQKHGELFALEPKHSKSGSTGFTKTHGFSPDVLDTIFQSCAHVAIRRGLLPVGNSLELYVYPDSDPSNSPGIIELIESYYGQDELIHQPSPAIQHLRDDSDFDFGSNFNFYGQYDELPN